MRLIDADALIQLLQTCADDDWNKKCPAGTWSNAYEEMILHVEDMSSVDPQSQWVPCSERLPDEAKKIYWVCTDTEYQCQCRWTNNVFGFGESDRWGWSIFDTPQYSKVIAWMPLPEPYKGDQ